MAEQHDDLLETNTDALLGRAGDRPGIDPLARERILSSLQEHGQSHGLRPLTSWLISGGALLAAGLIVAVLLLGKM